MSKPEHCFNLRKDGEFTWEIFDTTTGRTVVVEGNPYHDLPQDSADTLVDFMNSLSVVPDGDRLHWAPLPAFVPNQFRR